jgi:uncharacterized protein YbdZ (MbtH family)
VINHEEQYSIWLDGREIPAGWRPVGKSGPKDECLEYIDRVWTDMRPLSLRKKMEEMKNRPPPPVVEEPDEVGPTLVERLATGNHPIEIGLGPDDDLAVFRDSLERSYVHVKFPQTRGGTILGIEVDRSATSPGSIDMANPVGTLHLVGDLTLDYVKCRCIADLDLASLKGTGHLEILEAVD